MLDPHKVRRIRLERGMTQTQLAKAVGTSLSGISMIEHDPPKRNVLLVTAERIAEALDTPLDSLRSPNDHLPAVLMGRKRGKDNGKPKSA